MKKILISIFSLLIFVGSLWATPTRGNEGTLLSASHSVFSVSDDQFNVIQLNVPGENIEAPVFTQEGERIGFIRETGMLITESGLPVMNPTDGSIALYDEASQSFVDGANRTLAIFLNSHLGRHYLRVGGEFLTSITMDREVVMIGINTRAGGKTIYAFRNRQERGFWGNVGNFFVPRPHEYRFYDMNGRTINNDHLVHVIQTNVQAIWRSILVPGSFIANLIANNWTVSIVEILERTTLRELYTTMSGETFHPFDNLRCATTNQIVVTTDGHPVFINRRTNQLVDRFNSALFNVQSGLPIIFNEQTGEILTTNLQVQPVGDGVLLASMTVNHLLASGTPFYMGIIQTMFGSFDVPIFRNSSDPNNPDWRLMNGESASGITIDHSPSEVLDGETFAEWWERVFGGSNRGPGLFQILGWALAALIILLLLKPAILIISIFTSMIPSPRKRQGGGG